MGVAKPSGVSASAPLPTSVAICLASRAATSICGRDACTTSKPGTSKKIITTSRLRTLKSRANLKKSATASKNEK